MAEPSENGAAEGENAAGRRWKVDDEADLVAHNETTIERYAKFPEPEREDAHVERDADGYYVARRSGETDESA